MDNQLAGGGVYVKGLTTGQFYAAVCEQLATRCPDDHFEVISEMLNFDRRFGVAVSLEKDGKPIRCAIMVEVHKGLDGQRNVVIVPPVQAASKLISEVFDDDRNS